MIAFLRDWLKGGAAVMAVAYLVGYLGAFMHTTTEVHVVCAEHGDLIHADEDHAQVDTPSVQTQIKSTQSHDDHHDHCALAQLLQSGQHDAVARVIAPIPQIQVAINLEPEGLSTPIRGPTIKLVLLAPKTSPPNA